MPTDFKRALQTLFSHKNKTTYAFCDDADLEITNIKFDNF
jgi:hypothetical protein